MVALGCDHGGYDLMQEVIAYLDAQGIAYKNLGCESSSVSVDYPDYGKKVVKAILSGECDKGIRAALCSDCFSAEATRQHNDANILAMGGRVVGPGLAVKIVDTFLHTEFSGDERHKRRIGKIEED